MKDKTIAKGRSWRKRTAKRFARTTGRPVQWFNHQLVFSDSRREETEAVTVEHSRSGNKLKEPRQSCKVAITYQPVSSAPSAS